MGRPFINLTLVLLFAVTASAQNLYVVGDGVNFRSAPISYDHATGSGVIGKFTKGEKLKLIMAERWPSGIWYAVADAYGRQGWIKASLVTNKMSLLTAITKAAAPQTRVASVPVPAARPPSAAPRIIYAQPTSPASDQNSSPPAAIPNIPIGALAQNLGSGKIQQNNVEAPSASGVAANEAPIKQNETPPTKEKAPAAQTAPTGSGGTTTANPVGAAASGPAMADGCLGENKKVTEGILGRLKKLFGLSQEGQAIIRTRAGSIFHIESLTPTAKVRVASLSNVLLDQVIKTNLGVDPRQLSKDQYKDLATMVKQNAPSLEGEICAEKNSLVVKTLDRKARIQIIEEQVKNKKGEVVEGFHLRGSAQLGQGSLNINETGYAAK